MARARANGGGPGPPKCRTVSLSLTASLKRAPHAHQRLVIRKLAASSLALSFAAHVTSLVLQAMLLETFSGRAAPLQAKKFEQVVMNTLNAIAALGGVRFQARANNVLYADVQARVERLAPRLGVNAAMLREHVVDVLARADVTFGALTNTRRFLEQSIARDVKACLSRAIKKMLYQVLQYAAGLRWPGRARTAEEKDEAKNASEQARENVKHINAGQVNKVAPGVRRVYRQAVGEAMSPDVLPRLAAEPLEPGNVRVIFGVATWLKARGAPLVALSPTHNNLQYVRYDANAVVDMFPVCKAAAKRAVERLPKNTAQEKRLATFKRAAFSQLLPGVRRTVVASMSSFTCNGTVVRVLCTPGGESQGRFHGGGGNAKASKAVWLDSLSPAARAALAHKTVVVCDPNLDDVGVFARQGRKGTFRITRASLLRARDTRRQMHAQEEARKATRVRFQGQRRTVAAIDEQRRTSDIGRCVDLDELFELAQEDTPAFAATWTFSCQERWRKAQWRSERGEQRLLAALMHKFRAKFGPPEDVVVYLGNGSCFSTHCSQLTTRVCRRLAWPPLPDSRWRGGMAARRAGALRVPRAHDK